MRLAQTIGYSGGTGFKMYVPEVNMIIVTKNVHMVEKSAFIQCTPGQPYIMYRYLTEDILGDGDDVVDSDLYNWIEHKLERPLNLLTHYPQLMRSEIATQ